MYRLPALFSIFAVAALFLLLLSVPAKAQTHPFRLTVGVDSSRNEGFTGGSDFEYGYSRVTGALRFGVSFDFYRDRANGLVGLVYADLNSPVIDGSNTGYGVGVRFYPVPKLGGYGGGGIGLYDEALRAPSGGGGRKVGLKFSLGYETRSALFVETGLTLISAEGYQASPAFLIGFRL